MPALGGKPWVALIVRSERAKTECSFDVKVPHRWPSCNPKGHQARFLAAPKCWNHLTGRLYMRTTVPHCWRPNQVRHAEEAGAAAAIVYDDVYEALIIMSKPRDHPEPGIPAVFVAQKTGIVVRKLMTPASTLVRITPVRARAPV